MQQTMKYNSVSLWETSKLSNLFKKKVTVVILLIAVSSIVFVINLPVLSAKARCYNDNEYVFGNLLVRSPSWSSVQRFFFEILEPSTVAGYYQPLTMVSFMVDYMLSEQSDDLKPFPFHRTNLLLHTFNTAMVVVLIYLIFGQVWIAALLGLLFGLHPMTVEATAWVGERKTLLAGFFGLSSLIFYVLFTHKQKQWLFLSCLVLYLLGLFSKPTILLLPIGMLVLDYWPLERLNKHTVVEKIPFFVLMMIFSVIAYISQKRTFGATLPNEDSLLRIPLVLCHNIAFYVRDILYPTRLTPYHIFPESMGFSIPAVRIGVLFTCVLFFLILLSMRWTHGFAAGWLFFLIVILPTMQIVGYSVFIASDKYAYLPSIGFLIMLASFLRWISNKIYYKHAVSHGLLIVTVLILSLLEIRGTQHYLQKWADSEILYTYMLEITPGSAALHWRLGMALESEKGDIIHAAPHFEIAANSDPLSPRYQHRMGLNLILRGYPEEGKEHLLNAIKINPNYVYALKDMAWILATHPDPNVRNPDEALLFAKQAAQQMKYGNVKILDVLAAAWAENGRFDQAITNAEKAIWIAQITNEKKLSGLISKRLELYRQGKPYREEPIQQLLETITDS